VCQVNSVPLPKLTFGNAVPKVIKGIDSLLAACVALFSARRNVNWGAGRHSGFSIGVSHLFAIARGSTQVSVMSGEDETAFDSFMSPCFLLELSRKAGWYLFVLNL